MLEVGDVPVEDGHPSLLQFLGAGDEGHQCRFADAVGTDDADHETSRNIKGDAVEGHCPAVAVGHLPDGDHWPVGGCGR